MNQLIVYILIAFAVCLALTMLAVTDTLRKDFGSGKAKFTWHMIALIPFVGWLIYFLFGARRGTRI